MKTIFKPKFEDPISSAKDMIDNNITVYMGPGYDFWVRFLADSPIPEYQTLSKRTIFPNDWDEYDQWTVEFVIEKGTHTFLGSYLTAWEKTLGRYWKGEKLEGDYPYGGYLSDKNWHLNEAFDIFSLYCLAPRLNQVLTVSDLSLRTQLVISFNLGKINAIAPE